MNLLLLPDTATALTLGPGDPRREHILKVLGCGKGDRFDVGAENGPRGKATVVADTAGKGLELRLEWHAPPPPPHPLTLVLPFIRPQAARRVLQDGTAVGVRRFLFFAGEKSERSYAEAGLWKHQSYREYLRKGAEQAFSTWIPEVGMLPGLAEAVEAAAAPPNRRLALDVYESAAALGTALPGGREEPIVLAVGGERGWSPAERRRLDAVGYIRAHLGSRVLRTETAAVAGAGILAAAHGWLRDPEAAIPRP